MGMDREGERMGEWPHGPKRKKPGRLTQETTGLDRTGMMGEGQTTRIAAIMKTTAAHSATLALTHRRRRSDSLTALSPAEIE